MAMPLQQHIVYGPVRSRRLGRSLGVNVLPSGVKVCNMNCAYCQYGWTRGEARRPTRRATWPSPAQVGAAVTARLLKAARDGELLEHITVAGHGEPTLHPQFLEIAQRLVDVRDRIAPHLHLSILSNSTTAAWPDVRQALGLFDHRFMKLDAGDPFTYARINGPGTSIAAIVDALRGLPAVVVQSMFVSDGRGCVDNTSDGAVTEWLRAIDVIQPSRVHIYTLDRPPSDGTLRRVSVRRLREIAERVRAQDIAVDLVTPEAPALRAAG